MAAHRVEELRLRLSTDSPARTDLRETAERFVASVLEAAGNRLEAKWPGRIIFLRHLPLHWMVSESELSDQSAIAQYADELAASVDTPGAGPCSGLDADDELVVFRDEAHWLASYLSAVTAGDGEERGWVYEALRAQGISLASLAKRGRSFALAVLKALAEAGTLTRVASATEPLALESVSNALGISIPASRLEADESRVTFSALRAALIDHVRTLAGQVPHHTLSLIVYVEAVRIVGESVSPNEVAVLVASVLEEVAAAPARQLVAREADSAAPLPASLRQGFPLAEAPSALWHTRFGGVFYLLALALEMEIGEALWKICLDEGRFLAHCAAALLGPAAEQDPAPLLFGGMSAVGAAPEVSPQQQEEVAALLTGNLAAALPRRSLAKLPQVVLSLARASTTELLVAAERGNPFPVFVCPVSNPRDVNAGLQKFLNAWPPSCPPVFGTPSIAELEGHQRVRAISGLAPEAELFLPRIGSAWTSALIAQVVGVLGHLFVARADGERPPSATAFIDRYLAVPARVEMLPQDMRIAFPVSRVDIAIRRAGLDCDPGWVPWMERTVRFIFEEDSQPH